ncbi:MAG: hypothetical protein DRP84_04960 [Spirochaetes bacterium]|nr:MAG: hypothetical protein DRP84_04960 [Spirochaetota bacterium]
MNKKIFCIFLLILIMFGITYVNADTLKDKISRTIKGDVGIGIILGEPTGISFKIFTQDLRAVDIALAWALKKNQYLRIHLDYLLNENEYLINELGIPLSLNYGIGLKSITGRDFIMGIRFYTGVFHRFKSPNTELFLELVPSMIIIPATVFDMDGAIGFRFYLRRKDKKEINRKYTSFQ